MLPDPRRAEENLAASLQKLRSATRMRYGIVAGVIIAGLLHTNFNVVGDGDPVAALVQMFFAVMPVLWLGAAGAVIVFALSWRDSKRLLEKHEAGRFRIPVRKSRK